MPLKLSIQVILALFLFLATPSCRKQESSKPKAITSGMGRVRNWHGSHYYDAYGVHISTPKHEFYYFPDTSFALVVVDDTTIQMWGDNYKYQCTDTAKQIYFFGTAYYFYKYGMGKGIFYYYAKDSIVYCYGDRHGTSDFWEFRDLRYTY